MVESRRKQFQKEYMKPRGITYVFWVSVIVLCFVMFMFGYMIGVIL